MITITNSIKNGSIADASSSTYINQGRTDALSGKAPNLPYSQPTTLAEVDANANYLDGYISETSYISTSNLTSALNLQQQNSGQYDALSGNAPNLPDGLTSLTSNGAPNMSNITADENYLQGYLDESSQTGYSDVLKADFLQGQVIATSGAALSMPFSSPTSPEEAASDLNYMQGYLSVTPGAINAVMNIFMFIALAADKRLNALGGQEAADSGSLEADTRIFEAIQNNSNSALSTATQTEATDAKNNNTNGLTADQGNVSYLSSFWQGNSTQGQNLTSSDSTNVSNDTSNMQQAMQAITAILNAMGPMASLLGQPY